MRFVVLKSSMDGISGGTQSFLSIDEALREISYHRGWDSREQLHTAIRKWAIQAEPGSVFQTSVSAVVAVGIGRGVHADDVCTECGAEGMEYEEMSPVEGGDIEQIGWCPDCGARWNDVYVLADRRELTKKKNI